MLHAQEAIEHLPKWANMMQVIKNDDARQVAGTVFTLFCDVGQVLS